MSAILSADDLNDFINPGVACIKPVETLPKQQPTDTNEFEVTTEDKVSAATAPPAQISLTDCLACSGCVTSAEAVLVSLQSHGEVLDTLDKFGELQPDWERLSGSETKVEWVGGSDGRKIFIASVSPQARASLAATYGVSQREAGHMIQQLLSGPYGLRAGGAHGSGFAYILDTNVMRDACLVAAGDEVQQSIDGLSDDGQKRPILTSACPGWICYAEKTHPHILPHLSKLKSPQALTGTLVKSVLAKKYGVPPAQVWHLAIMPCFDKKLEASRAELTSHTWHGQDSDAIRDVDCVITARELLMLAESRNISFPCLPKTRVSPQFRPRFPDKTLNSFLFQSPNRPIANPAQSDIDLASIGTSGGYLHAVLQSQQRRHPNSRITHTRGRNADVSEFSIVDPTTDTTHFRAARYYGFRNIQNLVRRLKPARASRVPGAAVRKPGAGSAAGAGAQGTPSDYAYVEVMACPGGCTNGGGQVKVGDVATLRQTPASRSSEAEVEVRPEGTEMDIDGPNGEHINASGTENDNARVTGIVNGSAEQRVLPLQKEWLANVDEAYWSESASESESGDDVSGLPADSEPVHGDEDEVMNGIHDLSFAPDTSLVKSQDPEDYATYIRSILHHWSHLTGVEVEKLITTSYRAVVSDVGKNSGSGGAKKDKSELNVERVSALAVAQGGGW